MNEMLQKTADALCARGFNALVFSTPQQAKDYILSDIPADAEVGIGGSETAHELGIDPALRERGSTVHNHRGVHGPETPPIRRAELLAPYFICSANALTTDGVIVQIDGTGNRVAALCYGPSVVYMVVGRNKIVEGGYQQAVKRIKQVACPQNARRLGLNTPCATGSCNASACKNSMCNIIMSLERAPGGKTTKVLLVDTDLGY